MRLSTKNVLLMIALLSVNLVDGRNKCIVRKKSPLSTDVAKAAEPTSAAAPIIADINDAPIEDDDEEEEQEQIPAPKKIIPSTKKITITKENPSSSSKIIIPTITSVKTIPTSSPSSSPSSSSSSSSSKSGKSLPNITSGTTGKTTRYWDCCLASCSWKENTNGSAVKACKADGVTLVTDELYKVRNGCEDGGKAYMCNDNQPWAINDNISYGFVAAAFQNGSQKDWCCSCYRMQFTSGAAKGKQMIVQVTNTGYDLSDNHFDIQMPGGGVGVFNGCQSQWNTSVDGWGQRYGGISKRSECDNLPKQLRDGCYWRFDWFLNSDNPSVIFERVQCPTELTSKSGCVPPDNSKYKAIPWN